MKRFLIGVLVLTALAGELLVNVNTATVDELQEVKGIGPVLSGRIVEGRPFTAVDSLTNVKGIGVKTLAKIKPFFTVSDTTYIYYEAKLDGDILTLNIDLSKSLGQVTIKVGDDIKINLNIYK